MENSSETGKVKSNKVKALEQNLIEYLMNRKDIEEKMGTGYRRLRSLQLHFNDKDPKHVTFTVQIGMFEAEFEIKSGLKERGSCFGLERMIRDWCERDSVKAEMIALTSANTGGGGSGGDGFSTNVRNLLR